MEPSSPHSEREWILIGIAECCAAKGYEATTVDDVCAAAGVSRESFDRVFAGKDECLGAAMETAVEEAWRALESVLAPGKRWAAVALLGMLAARPALAHLALVEAPLAGGRAAVLHESGRAALLDFLELGREQAAEPGVPASVARGALAGAEALVLRQLTAGEAGRLGELAPDVVYMLTVPFLGVDEAGRLAGGAARRRHLRAVA